MLDVESDLSVPMGDGANRPVQPAPISAVARLMAESGFDAAWLPLSAAAMGAPHGRTRWWAIGFREPEQMDDAAPDGAVIIMTTNHPELLDPALLRPGRVDVRVNFGPATREQIMHMCSRLNPKAGMNGNVEDMLAQKYTTAQVQAELLSTRLQINS